MTLKPPFHLPTYVMEGIVKILGIYSKSEEIISFYYATIAYHVGLIAVLGWPQGIMANV